MKLGFLKHLKSAAERTLNKQTQDVDAPMGAGDRGANNIHDDTDPYMHDPAIARLTSQSSQLRHNPDAYGKDRPRKHREFSF